MHRLVQMELTFLTVILFELADVFVQELVWMFVVFCLQFKKLQSDKHEKNKTVWGYITGLCVAEVVVAEI